MSSGIIGGNHACDLESSRRLPDGAVSGQLVVREKMELTGDVRVEHIDLEMNVVHSGEIAVVLGNRDVDSLDTLGVIG
ncbi:hypothetical protein V6N13_073257 [Hibiscus sabdariffa]